MWPAENELELSIFLPSATEHYGDRCEPPCLILYCPGDHPQCFMHVRQALYALSYSPIPQVATFLNSGWHFLPTYFCSFLFFISVIHCIAISYTHYFKCSNCSKCGQWEPFELVPVTFWHNPISVWGFPQSGTTCQSSPWTLPAPDKHTAIF